MYLLTAVWSCSARASACCRSSLARTYSSFFCTSSAVAATYQFPKSRARMSDVGCTSHAFRYRTGVRVRAGTSVLGVFARCLNDRFIEPPACGATSPQLRHDDPFIPLKIEEPLSLTKMLNGSTPLIAYALQVVPAGGTHVEHQRRWRSWLIAHSGPAIIDRDGGSQMARGVRSPPMCAVGGW
jgi:hypothetical protein